MTGNEYRDSVADYLVKAHYSKGLLVYKEVSLGRSILGKRRRVDILATANGKMVALETKYQKSSGTAEEKIPHAISDSKSMCVTCGVVYAGIGWSDAVLWLLRRSAYYCHPGSGDTTELDYFLAVTLGWPDILLNGYTHELP